MSNLLSEVLKVDQAIVGGAVAPAAIAVSGLFPLDQHRKAMVAIGLTSADLQEGDVLDIGIVDDTVVTPAASGALAVLEAAGDTLAFEHITAGVHVSAMSIEFAAAADGAVVVNGTSFAYAAAPALPTEWSTAAEFIIAVNAAGLGITATSGGGTVVILRATVPGSVDITVTGTVTAITAADLVTLEAVAYLEVDASQLAPGATGIYAVVDNPVANTGTIAVGAMILRGEPRNAPVIQRVAAHS